MQLLAGHALQGVGQVLPGHGLAGGVIERITAVVQPATSDLVVGQSLSDTTNWSVFLQSSNYTPRDGETINSVTVDFSVGSATDASTVLADGDTNAFRILVTDTSGEPADIFTVFPRTVVHTPPVAAGGLADQAFAQNGGDQTVDASVDFTGSGITYSMNSVSNVAINAGTGVITFDTDLLAEQTGTVVTVTGTNSGGSDTSAFSFDITAFSVSQTNDGIDLNGATGTISVAVTSPAAYTSGTKGGSADSSPYSVDTTALTSGPVEIVSPSVTGTLETGNALTAQVPLFFYNAASLPTPTYQWERNTGGGYADISGATSLVLSALDNDTGGDVRLKASVTDDNGTTVITTGASTVAGGFTSINDSLFGSGEYGFFIDGTDSTEFYANEDLTGANPPVFPADIESIRDASPNNIVIQSNGGAGGSGSGPQWIVADSALRWNSDSLQAEMVAGNMTTTMTLMFASKDDWSNTFFQALFGRDAADTASWIITPRSNQTVVGVNCGSPTVYIDGVQETTFAAGWWDAAHSDGGWHLTEIRNLDLATLDWSTFNIGSKGDAMVQGWLNRSIVLTTNNNPTDIENARQFWVDNHGITLA